MKVKVIGIDLAKDVFGVHGVDAYGKALVHRRITRRQLFDLLTKLELGLCEEQQVMLQTLMEMRALSPGQINGLEGQGTDQQARRSLIRSESNGKERDHGKR